VTRTRQQTRRRHLCFSSASPRRKSQARPSRSRTAAASSCYACPSSLHCDREIDG
jgi:hypothetical protein